MKKKFFIPLAVLTLQSALFAEEELFNMINTTVNDSFIKVIAKNRASSADGSSNYNEITSKEEFLDALEKEELNKPINSNNFKKEYIYTEIRNVRVNENDLREIKGDTLRLGIDVKKGQVTQVLNIKNTNIKTDKLIDMTVKLDASERNSATSVTNIDNSELGDDSLDHGDFTSDSLIEEGDGLLPFK